MSDKPDDDSHIAWDDLWRQVFEDGRLEIPLPTPLPADPFSLRDEDLLSYVGMSSTDEEGNAINPKLMEWLPVRKEDVPTNLKKIEPFPKEAGDEDDDL